MRAGRWCGVLPAMVVAALLAGCGGSGSSAPPAAAGSSAALSAVPTPVPTPEAWTESVCAALVPVISRLTAAPGLDLNAPEATKQAYLTYLNEGVAVTDQARARLAAAGAAPVPDGDVIAEQVRGEVADLRVDLTAARDQVQRTDTSSAVAIGRAIVGVSRVVGALLNGAQVAATVNRDPTLAAAYSVSPSCVQLQRLGAPATAPPTAAVVPTR
jgi:ABC-type Na+ efflux pump permease subunit